MEVRTADDLRKGRPIIGDPNTWVAEIEAYIREMKVSEIVFYAVPPGMEPRDAFESIELFAREVMPHFAGS